MIQVVKESIYQALPTQVRNYIWQNLNRRRLASIEPIQCESTRLLTTIDRASLQGIFASQELHDEWQAVEKTLRTVIPKELSEGVNAGDARAMYYLVRHFKAASVLEIGTHVGVSTSHIAAALQKNQEHNPNTKHMLHTVDIRDVNNEIAQPWRSYGARMAPREVLRSTGTDHIVQFIIGRALDFLQTSRTTYDFIFLDGDHAANAVYREIPASLQRINPDGVIVLHDYYPDQRLSDADAILGPSMAVRRLQAEGASFEALPLATLPWATRPSSNKTSLALLVHA